MSTKLGSIILRHTTSNHLGLRHWVVVISLIPGGMVWHWFNSEEEGVLWNFGFWEQGMVEIQEPQWREHNSNLGSRG